MSNKVFNGPETFLDSWGIIFLKLRSYTVVPQKTESDLRPPIGLTEALRAETVVTRRQPAAETDV